MKKSILTIVLAALMLIGFTACEQPVYKVPTGLSVTSTRTAYLVGESIDMSTITGTLEYSDGSTRSVSGSELSVISSGNGQYVFGYSNLKATLEVTEYAIADIKSLAISELPATVVKDSTTVDVKGVATLPNGETSNVDVQLTITGAGTVGASVEPTIGAYKITLGTNSDTVAKDKVTGTDDWKVTVVTGKDFVATKIKSIKVEQTNPNADGKQWVLDNVSFKVIATDENGTTKELTTNEYTWKDGKAPASSYQLKKAAATEKYVAVLNADPSIVSAEFNYSAGTPWITNISVAKSDTSTAETTIASGTVTVSTYYKFNVEWAGGKDQAGTEWTYAEGTNGVLFNPTVPQYGSDTGEATTYTANFSLKYGKDDVWHSKTAPSYNITEA